MGYKRVRFESKCAQRISQLREAGLGVGSDMFWTANHDLVISAGMWRRIDQDGLRRVMGSFSVERVAFAEFLFPRF